MSPPLLNQYKLKYVMTTWVHTLSGLRLLINVSAPWYIHLTHGLIWISPCIIGSLFTLAAQLTDVSKHTFAAVYGCIMCFLSLLIGFSVAHIKGMCKDPQVTSTFSESDDVVFDGFITEHTLEYLFPSTASKLKTFLKSIVCGIHCGLAWLFLLVSRNEVLFPGIAGNIIYYLVGWIPVCIANYPLLGAPIKEPVVFNGEPYSSLIMPFMRPIYIALLSIAGLIMWECSLTEVDFVLHLVFLFLPLLWLLGIFPPLDALWPWVLEEVLVHVLGGSPMASDSRLLVMFVLSSCCVTIIHFIPNPLAALTTASVLGVVLSTDVTTFLMACYVRWKNRRMPKKLCSSLCIQAFGEQKFKRLLYLIFACGIAGAFVGTCGRFRPLQSASARTTLSCVLAALVGITLVLKACNERYILFGVIRNPLFRTSLSSAFESHDGWLTLSTIWKLTLHLVLPSMTLLLSSIYVLRYQPPQDFMLTLSSCRILRFVWQDPEASAIHICLYNLLVQTNFDLALWKGLSPPVQVLAIAFLCDRSALLLKKLWFMLTLFINSFLVKSLRNKTLLSAAVTLVGLPFTGLILAISVGLDAPLLPLFTLPLFILGFPRPKRMWPRPVSPPKFPSNDSVYYEQLTPSLCTEIQKVLSRGGMGGARAGSYYIARFQDRILWISVLESGLLYWNITIKGLELQETSCHSTEAVFLDESFCAAFEDGSANASYLNKSVVSAVTPSTVITLRAYSTASNVLTGVIDNPCNLKRISGRFLYCLVWGLVTYCMRSAKADSNRNDIKLGLRERRERPASPVASMNPICGASSTPVDDHEPARVGMVHAAREDTSHEANSRTSFLTRSPLSPHSSSPHPSPLIGLLKLPEERGIDVGHCDHTNADGLSQSGQDVNKYYQTLSCNLADSAGTNDDDFENFGFNDCESYSVKMSTASSADSVHSSSFLHNTARTTLPIKLTSEFAGAESDYVSALISSVRDWLVHIPDIIELECLLSIFPDEWFLQVLRAAFINSSSDEDFRRVASNCFLRKTIQDLVLTCYCLVNGGNGKCLAPVSADLVHRIFHGNLPWSPGMHWLEVNVQLHGIVIQAYRYAFKLVFDEAVLGAELSTEEMISQLKEFDENWYMGVQACSEWSEHVLKGTPKLLCLGKDNESTFRSQILTLQSIPVPIARVSSENTNGLWSSLVLELLYMANDDDERYSIQALPAHLRNITVQAAEPPLGYPVYNSGMVTLFQTL